MKSEPTTKLLKGGIFETLRIYFIIQQENEENPLCILDYIHKKSMEINKIKYYYTICCF